MHTLTLQIPDAQFPFILSELNKFKDIRIEIDSNDALKEEIMLAVNEINQVKKGKLKARPARELLSEL
ncbi:MAG: hypothetical protein NT007_08430 [Candidatus Kapabacteria bacterium]|nr:hypothetical protein [Candidatus Kapabacteria bacterium]